MYSRHQIPFSTSATKTLNSIRLRSNAYSIGSVVDYVPLYRYSFDIENDDHPTSSKNEELEEGEIQESEQQFLVPSYKKSSLFQEFIKQESSQIFRTNAGQIVPYALKSDDMLIYTKDKLDFADMRMITIKWVSSEGLKLRANLRYMETMSIKDDSTNLQYLRAMNAIVRHKAVCDLLNFGQTFFWPKNSTHCSEKVPMSNMLDCAFGIYLSGVLLTKRGPAVILDHTAAALTRGDNLVNLLEDFRIRNNSTRDNDKKRSRLSEPLQYLESFDTVIKDFSSTIIGLKIYIKHMKHKQFFKFKNYTSSSSDSTTFFWNEEKRDVTISEYFFRKHSIKLRYPNLPCIIRSSNDKQAMYPFELCYLLEDQKIKKSKLNPSLARRLDQTKESPPVSISPGKRSEYSLMINKVFNNISKSYLRDFSLELSNEPLTATGRMIEPPTVQYRDDKNITPKDGRWKAQKFVISSSVEHWFVVNACRMTNINQVESFVEGFRNYSFIYFGFSMSMPSFKDISKNNIDENAIHSVVSDCSRDCRTREGPQLILFVVPEKNDLYPCIHYVSDVLFGFNATCIQGKNIRPVSHPKESRMRFSTPVMTSLSQKINAKLGGINMRNMSPMSGGEIRENEFTGAMFVGCDVTHPDSGSSSASIAACVASCGADLFQYITSIRIQDNKNDEIVHRIDEMMKELLSAYMNRNNCLPTKIFFYRDGVSEDQFDQVKNLEISKLDALLVDTYMVESRPLPSLTFIIVQKRHRMRFFEEFSSEYRSQIILENPRPGTVVDNTITSPKDEDFYLYSHWNQKGTSRPSHYHVIRNDSRYTMEMLQKITYFMCHTYARCSQSISMPAVVRYAHLAAYRARVLLISANKVKFRTGSPRSGSSLTVDSHGNPNDMIKPNSLLRDTMYFC